MKFLNFIKGVFLFLKEDMINIFNTKDEIRFLKLFLYLVFFIFLIKVLILVFGVHNYFVTI